MRNICPRWPSGTCTKEVDRTDTAIRSAPATRTRLTVRALRKLSGSNVDAPTRRIAPAMTPMINPSMTIFPVDSAAPRRLWRAVRKTSPRKSSPKWQARGARIRKSRASVAALRCGIATSRKPGICAGLARLSTYGSARGHNPAGGADRQKEGRRNHDRYHAKLASMPVDDRQHCDVDRRFPAAVRTHPARLGAACAAASARSTILPATARDFPARGLAAVDGLDRGAVRIPGGDRAGARPRHPLCRDRLHHLPAGRVLLLACLLDLHRCTRMRRMHDSSFWKNISMLGGFAAAVRGRARQVEPGSLAGEDARPHF